MKRGFRPQRRIRAPRWLWVTALLGICLIAYELYDVIIPFQAQNPLFKEVTVGQPVINSWSYGGEDEEGYLKFVNSGGVTDVLPPDSHLVSLDGQFVVIEHFTPGTLTYALPMEAISLPWLIGGVAVIAGGVWVLHRRLKSVRSVRQFGGKRFRAQRTRGPATTRSFRTKRFRSKYNHSRFR